MEVTPPARTMKPETPIYMDSHATTPVDERVLEEMLPFLRDEFGNASSRSHIFGWAAEAAVDRARERVAELIGGHPKEIVFTSGATESDNLAIKGAAATHRDGRRHIITQATEHHAVLDTCRALARQGCDITVLPVDRHGQVSADAIGQAITDRTLLVSIMAANNEIGTLQPIQSIGKVCRDRDVLFHVDAAQALGKVPVDVESACIDLLSVTAHKLYGPKGVGALYVRSHPRVRLVGQMDGGGHERGLRSGTLNVPGIAGLGKACEIAGAEMQQEAGRVRRLRDRLQKKILDDLNEVYLNGHPKERLDANLNLSFKYIDGESLLMGLSDVALSSGSACTSASLEPSYVLRATGLRDDLAQGSLRFGLGRFNSMEEVEYVGDRVISEVRRLREISPHYEQPARQS